MSSLNYFARIDMTLHGITSIIMHNRYKLLPMPPKTTAGPQGNSGNTRPSDADMRAQAMKGRYVDKETDCLYMPARAVWWAIVRAGHDFTATGNERQNMQKLLERTLYLQEERFFLLGDDSKPLKGDKATVCEDPIVNKMKGAVWSYRAEVEPPWFLQATFFYNLRATNKSLADLVEAAVQGGFQNGIGAWRPEHKGRHGQYEIDHFAVNGKAVNLHKALESSAAQKKIDTMINALTEA